MRGQTVEWSGVQHGICRHMINHQAAVNGVIAPDSKWQISVSLILTWSLPLPPLFRVESINVNITVKVRGNTHASSTP